MRRAHVFLRGAAAGLFHVVLLGLAFAPTDLWPLTFLALLPQLWIAPSCRANFRWIAAGAWLGAAVAWLWFSRWLINVTVEGYPLLALYLASYVPLFLWLLARAPRLTLFSRIPRAILIPILWVGLEVLRGEVVFTGYAWFLLAHPLVHFPALAQSADILGAYWLSGLVAASSVVAWDAVSAPQPVGTNPSARRWIAPSLLVLLWIALFVYGQRALRLTPLPGSANSITVCALQTNLPQDNKIGWKIEDQERDFASFVDATRASLARSAEKPDLMVWPETMVPGLGLNPEAIAEIRRFEREVGDRLRPGTTFHERLLSLAQETLTPLLVGATAAPDLALSLRDRTTGRIEVSGTLRYNSAFLYLPGNAAGLQSPVRYDKVHLTPFGEMIPLLRRWPALQQFVLDIGAHGMSFDLSIGADLRTLEVPLRSGSALRVGTPICFESTVSGLCRALVVAPDGRKRADVLINLTNDGWFGLDPGGRAQHLQISQWRAIENRVPVVRAANTGISALIDSAGRILVRGPNEPAVAEGDGARAFGMLRGQVALDGRTPLFARIGNVFGWTCLALTAAYALLALFFGRQRT